MQQDGNFGSQYLRFGWTEMKYSNTLRNLNLRFNWIIYFYKWVNQQQHRVGC